ncbi:centrosomal protein of 57 kDa-like [Antedon mediterranea]|uniref:centrosomal protein of 57 kDa-like n=1 Tax=Antedon mediterranea TaxID=105859 RepID=UPI003AF758C7
MTENFMQSMPSSYHVGLGTDMDYSLRNDSISSYNEYPHSRPLLDDQYAPGRSPRNTNSAPETKSRAIISALRGLQDKIRKLELERTQAEQNLKSLASETTQYKEILQKEHTAKEETQTEISKQTKEVELHLDSAESRCNLLEKQLEYMRKMVQNSEHDRNRALHERKLIVNAREKEEVEEIQLHQEKVEKLERDNMKLQATQTRTQKKIQQLEEKVREEQHHRRLVQEKAAELQTETEMNRIMLASNTPPQPTKPKKKKKRRNVQSSQPAKAKPTTTKGSHYRANFKTLPFVAGKSTTPSHSLSSNLQSVLAMLKTHNPAWCNNGPLMKRVNGTVHRRPSVSSSTSESDLADLMLGLQDEFGQMGFEHQEIARQIQETDDRHLREDLERELEQLVIRMEAKGEQIAKLKRHKSKALESKKKTKKRAISRSSSVSIPSSSNSAEVQVITTVKTKGSRVQPITVKNQPPRQNKTLLRDIQTLQTTLRRDDVCWE